MTVNSRGVFHKKFQFALHVKKLKETFAMPSLRVCLLPITARATHLRVKSQ